MSELATNYYEERAQRLGIRPMPSLLDGRAVHLWRRGEGDAASILPDRFGIHARSVQSFAIDGLRDVWRAQGRPPTDAEWEEMRARPAGGRALTAEEYVRAKMMQRIGSVLQLGGEVVTLEAIARSEVSPHALTRVETRKGEIRDPAYESAQAYLLTRTLDGDDYEHCRTAHVTVLWAKYHEVSNGVFFEHPYGLTTPIYSGTALTQGELYNLPPLAD